MKRAIVFLVIGFYTVALMGSTDSTFYTKMGETISQFNTSQSIEDFQKLANKFKVIANVEPGEWLPLYYEAHCYILMSFMNGSSTSKDGYLDQASSILDRMLELAPGEAEVHVLKAFYYTGRMVVNPQDRAPSVSPLIYASLGKAMAIDPTNPRAKFLKLSNELGTASFFGSDTEPFKVQANELINNWDAYKIKSPIHPNWGKNQVEEIVKSFDN